MSSPFGAQLAWRQLVDLVGRGRVEASEAVIARLRTIRASVPSPVRTATARAVAAATPPLALVTVFTEDEIAIAAPVLRTVHLPVADWAVLLPTLSPTARSILRHRRDLPADLTDMLASFGSVDFVLAAPNAKHDESAEPYEDDAALWAKPPEAVSAGDHDDADTSSVNARPVAATPDTGGTAGDGAVHDTRSAKGRFEIAELVRRINAYQHARETPTRDRGSETMTSDPEEGHRFRFESDTEGVIRWVEGVARSAIIGISLARAAGSDARRSGVDGGVTGAFRKRTAFVDLRLHIDGESDAAGAWRISAVPVFDRATGRFTGYRGSARRPRVDETAEPLGHGRAAADALRQLVHELRTPTNAIAGFSEMIETELLGPVPEPYRERATVIRSQTAGLMGAIEDMDIAARIETNALQLFVDDLPVAALLERIGTDLAPLAASRGTVLQIDTIPGELTLRGDERAVERLIGRLLATLVASSTAGERIALTATRAEPDGVMLVFDRPQALAGYAGDALLSIAPDDGDSEAGGYLLGTGFALRLARNLAIELGGSLAIDATTLTLHLPTMRSIDAEQASYP